MAVNFNNRYRFNTGVVTVTIYAGKDLILGIELDHSDKLELDGVFLTKSNNLIEQTLNQLQEFFNKERTEFDLPLDLSDDKLVQKVVKEIKKVKFGETLTFSELSKNIGEDVKEVKKAIKNIKFPLLIPVHRIVDEKKKTNDEAFQSLLNFEK